jgi:hypothetical protein
MRHFLVSTRRTTLFATAVLAVCSLAQPAQAQLLGGSGSLAGGLNGGVGPRNLALDGSAQGAGSVQRSGALLQRGQQAGNNAAQRGSEAQARVITRTSAAAEAGAERGQQAGAAVRESARDTAASATARSMAAASTGRPQADASGAAAVSGERRQLDGDAAARAQVTRGDRSVSAEASAEGGVRR